ncbi:MAG: 2-hydroxyacid dehydrogenase [Armatimonadota bacterium]
MNQVAFFDTKPYDREYFTRAISGSTLVAEFHEFRLNTETASSVEDSSAVCVFVNDKLDRPCLEQLARSGVRMVALRCAGFNNVDIAVAKQLDIAVTRVPAYSPHAVAEHAVALLLTLNRKIHRAHNRVREHNFALEGLVGFDLFGKTVGIVGTGKIGRAAAQIFRGFGTEVVAYDPFPMEGWAQDIGVQYVQFSELLSRCDIVSLHLPLTPDSVHLINQHSISQMKRGAYLVNTSRGKLVDTSALFAALQGGQLGGVALDVYEEEEGIFFEDHSNAMLGDEVLSRLLTFPNVLLTAHQAFLTHEALTAIATTTAENVKRFYLGHPFTEGSVLA